MSHQAWQYSFPVTPCTAVELDLWDQMIARVLIKNYKLPRSFPRAMLKEDLHNFGMGPSVVVKYYSRSTNALIDSLCDTKSRRGRISLA
jgi:hypothetical protein